MDAAAIADFLRFRQMEMNPSKRHNGTAKAVIPMPAIAPTDKCDPGSSGTSTDVAVTGTTDNGTEAGETLRAPEAAADVCSANPSI